MGSHEQAVKPHLFTLRLWLEPLSDGRVEIRGEMRHVLSGRRRAVRDWITLIQFVHECVDARDLHWTASHPPNAEDADATH